MYYLHITVYIGKEGYELVHCGYLISEEGQLCIFKKEK